MAQLRQWLSQKASTRLFGLIAIGLAGIGLMMSCNEDNSSKPTASNIPMFPEGQSSDNSEEMGFYSSNGDGQFGAWAGDLAEFQIGVPAGEYLLTYSSTVGTFYVAFRATNAAILHIGLLGNDRVASATIQKGKITNESVNKWGSNAVTLFAWPGSGVAWNVVFQSDGSWPINLIVGGQVASGINKLSGPEGAPISPTTTTTEPATTTTTQQHTTTTKQSTTTTTTSTSTTTTTTTTQVDFSGSANAGEYFEWEVNVKGKTNTKLTTCGVGVELNVGQASSIIYNMDVTFASGAGDSQTTTISTDGSGSSGSVMSEDYVTKTCPVTWSATCNNETIGGTSSNGLMTYWEVNPETCLVTPMRDCEVTVKNVGTANITILFSGGNRNAEQVLIEPNTWETNDGENVAGECPVSWALVQ